MTTISQEKRDEKRRAFLEKFLREMVIPDNFTSEDAMSLRGGSATDFCEYFELGDWFISEVANIDFDIDDFLSDLASDLRDEERGATEDYYERQQEYREMQGGLC